MQLSPKQRLSILEQKVSRLEKSIAMVDKVVPGFIEHFEKHMATLCIIGETLALHVKREGVPLANVMNLIAWAQQYREDLARGGKDVDRMTPVMNADLEKFWKKGENK